MYAAGTMTEPPRWFLGKGPTPDTVTVLCIGADGKSVEHVTTKAGLVDLATSLRDLAATDPEVAAAIIRIEGLADTIIAIEEPRPENPERQDDTPTR